MRSLRIFLIATLVAGATPPALAQQGGTLAARPQPTLVLIPDSYPAFATPPEANAMPLRAVIMLRDPAHGDSSVIILNPAHADAHTLYEALSVVRRLARSGEQSRNRDHVVLGMRPGVREPHGAVVARLQAVLARVREAPSASVRGQLSAGRATRVDDVLSFFPDGARPAR